ncbi:Uncharacterised protein [Vibrio cholerae]|nr:Uncharacterised protein [Vibrio cholerae]CSD03539.1 Uncharacterised protein [Vibrio cholerae]
MAWGRHTFAKQEVLPSAARYLNRVSQARPTHKVADRARLAQLGAAELNRDIAR